MKPSQRIKAEREAKAKDKQADKAARRGRGVGLQRRRPQARPSFPKLLIVCEGEKTEPEYFKAFPVRGVDVTVEGLGDNTLSLVTRAIELHEDGGYDETWVVFDRDSFPPERFRASIEKATAAGLQVAYTNEAFEAWYLMHFHYCDAALSRETYAGRLADALGRPYRKRDPGMYWALLSRQPDAIRNANKLLDHHGPGHDPESANPSTTVHRLVERLNALR